MKQDKKRKYHSKLREDQAKTTKENILKSARILFQKLGYEHVTLNEIASHAKVSTPSIYSIFQSKLGILRVLMDDVMPLDLFNELVEKARVEPSGEKRLAISAKITRFMYEAEEVQTELFRGAAALSPEFKKLEHEKEKRRYDRQKETIEQMVKEKSLKNSITTAQARDILWAFTGRDMYRMFVTLRKWSADDYEKWLHEILVKALIK